MMVSISSLDQRNFISLQIEANVGVDQLTLIVEVFREPVLVSPSEYWSVKRQVEPLMDIFTIIFCEKILMTKCYQIRETIDKILRRDSSDFSG